MEDVLNLNTAEKDELTHLPGVGPEMADRIMASRPYETIDDLRKVSGVGPVLFERLQPLITVSDPEPPEDVIFLDAEVTTEPAAEQPEEIEEPETEIDEEIPEQPPEDGSPQDEAEPAAEGTEAAGEAIPKDKAIIPLPGKNGKGEKPGKTPKTVTWGQTFLTAAVCSLFAIILAVLLSLGIIGSLNNGLRYASSEQVRVLNQQLNGLESQIDILMEDIDSLRTRVDNLESMSARISELESQMEQLGGEMAATAGMVDEMNTQIVEILESTSRFQNFLDGLGELMDNLVNAPEEAPE